MLYQTFFRSHYLFACMKRVNKLLLTIKLSSLFFLNSKYGQEPNQVDMLTVLNMTPLRSVGLCELITAIGVSLLSSLPHFTLVMWLSKTPIVTQDKQFWQSDS